MDRRFVTVLGVSLVFALVVSGIFYQFSRTSSGGSTGPREQKDLVVAAKPLSVGMMLKAEDVKLTKVATDAFPKGGFSKIEEVAERPVISNILLDEPVLDGRLATKGEQGGLAPAIPVGMRAVSVRITDVVGVAGYVQPGLRVDVLVTGRPPRGQLTMTTTVLQNLLVLSTGTTLVPDARGQAMSAPSVTLLVTPQQAEILTLASNEGRIQLVLRNSKDDKVSATPGSDADRLYAGGKLRAAYSSGDGPVAAPGEEPPEEKPVEKPRPRPRPDPPPRVFVPKLVAQPPPDEIVVIRGATRTVERVMQSVRREAAAADESQNSEPAEAAEVPPETAKPAKPATPGNGAPSGERDEDPA